MYSRVIPSWYVKFPIPRLPGVETQLKISPTGREADHSSNAITLLLQQLSEIGQGADSHALQCNGQSARGQRM